MNSAAGNKETLMCGIAGIFGSGWDAIDLMAMVFTQEHRGPDTRGVYISPGGTAGLGHNRLSILDLSESGRQPMRDASGHRWIVFNGEIYNYLELRRELDGYPFRSQSDTEVLLAAYDRWGEACLDRLVGMFAFLLWDEREQCLFAARDRFGVKPLYYHQRTDGTLLASSEMRALYAGGVPEQANPQAWSSYLTYGLHDHAEQTFSSGILSLPPGHRMTWRAGKLLVQRWYDLAERVGPEFDERSVAVVQEEYTALLRESVALRFRSDVPVAINISGGLDSSLLLGLVDTMTQGAGSEVLAFTYTTGDAKYDETPWVEQMLSRTRHRSVVSQLHPRDVPSLAVAVQSNADGPFGGLPTLAYAGLFQLARSLGVVVLLDGQGMDEQWAGYDYYGPLAERGASGLGVNAPLQGTRTRALRPECLLPEFRALAEPLLPEERFPDAMRNRQYLDTCFTKLPRALRFNDRVSMRHSTELREPFLDHRLFELALRQPADRKVRDGCHKWMLRRIGAALAPAGVVESPKRPVQTPQREWLAGPLRRWAHECIELAVEEYRGEWLDSAAVAEAWRDFQRGDSDNSFYVWQWINLGLAVQNRVAKIA
jgi:asparagine synthase (glutamine-hydrolysing)